MTYLPPDSALHRLAHEELCFIVLHDGRRYEAIWSANNKGFYYRDGGQPHFVSHDEIYEWWPASVRF